MNDADSAIPAVADELVVDLARVRIAVHGSVHRVRKVEGPALVIGLVVPGDTSR
jgi:hypothetical protein